MKNRTRQNQPRMSNMPNRASIKQNNQINAIPLSMALLLFFSACSSQVWSQSYMGDESDPKEKSATEFGWKLPAPPLPENQLQFYVNWGTEYAFAVDTKSLSVDPDGVIRYTMIGTSPAGAKNISYEGIRCATMEKRTYAYGQANGSWTQARLSEWRNIPTVGPVLQHATLADLVCRNGKASGDAHRVLDFIRYQRVER